ncbi:hypothetical protein PENTCL1PPCAC_14333, partial [Pristionchus entomophagus]
RGRSFKKVFIDFAQWCTLVCLNKITSGSRWLAVIYTIVFLIMLFLFVFISVNLVLKYLKYPSSTELKLDVQPEMFPRFSFCNENPLKRSIVVSDPAFAEIAKLMQQFEEVENKTRSTDDFGISTSSMRMQRLSRGKTMLRLQMNKLSDADRIRGGYSFTDLVSECTFAGKTCSSGDFGSFLHPEYGVCFTFISQRQITMVGADQGLRMLLTVNQDSVRFNVYDYLPTTDGATIRAVVHQPEEFPDFATTGFKIGSSRQASIALSSMGNSRAEKPYGNCTNQGDDVDNHYANFTYSFFTCQASCMQHLAWEKCVCVDPLYLKSGEHVYCVTPDDSECVHGRNGSARLCDHCVPSCNDTRLERTITYGVFPSAKYKVAAGTQSQRDILLLGQSGGRSGEAFEDADDYDERHEINCSFYRWLSESTRYNHASTNISAGATACRNIFPEYFDDPDKFTIIQGWPCLSTKPCQTCVMFTDPSTPAWDWPCTYFTYEQCTQYKQNSTTSTSCQLFFLNFDFIPTGVDAPNISDWQTGKGPSSSVCRLIMPYSNVSRAACWKEGDCVRIGVS